VAVIGYAAEFAVAVLAWGGCHWRDTWLMARRETSAVRHPGDTSYRRFCWWAASDGPELTRRTSPFGTICDIARCLRSTIAPTIAASACQYPCHRRAFCRRQRQRQRSTSPFLATLLNRAEEVIE